VFESIRDLQSIASTIAFNQPATADTFTSRDFKYIQHKGHLVEVAKLTAGIQQMLKDVREKMYALSGGKRVRLIIPKDHVDDFSSTGRGMSWMDNCGTAPRIQALMSAMIEEGKWNLSIRNENGGLMWNRTACQKFMDQVADILDTLISLTHLGGGPPVRGEELVRDQITNGIQIRTLYRCFDQMVLIRRRSKDTHARGIDAFNICYLPKALTDVLTYYLLVIRPLERVVAWQLYQSKERCLEYDMYLWVKHGKRMTSAEFSAALKYHTRTYIGVELTINPTRHVMIAFMRTFLEPAMIEKGNNIGDLMSSHNTKTSLDHYAQQIGNLEGVTDLLMSEVRSFCDSYHDAIGLGKRTGPLIPTLTKRDIAQKLVLAASMDPRDPAMIGVVGEILEQLGETAFRAGLEQLKAEVVKEIWAAVSEGFERIISEQGPQRRSAPHRPPQPTQPHQHTGTAQASGLKRPRTPPSHPSKRATGSTLESRSQYRPIEPEQQEPEEQELELEYASAGPVRTPTAPAEARPTGPQPDSGANHTTVDPEEQLKPASGAPVPVSTTAGVSHPNRGNQHTLPHEDLGNYQWPWGTDELLDQPNSPDRQTAQQGSIQEAQVVSTVRRMSTMTLEPHPEQPAAREMVAVTADRSDPPEEPDVIMNLDPDPEQHHLEQPPTGEVVPITAAGSDPEEDRYDYVQHLRRYLRDPHAQFRGKQKELLKAMEGSQHIVAVLPTGAGKSVAYELPPLYRAQITIVGIPFRLIISQVVAKAEKRGFAAKVWYSRTPKILEPGLGLIIVPYETLLTDEFST